VALVLLTLAAGCGGSASNTTTAPGAPRQDSATESDWRDKAEQFAHELDAALQALASTARTDAYQAVSNLGPLTYCSQNLGAVGSPPPVYQLAFGSLSAACDQFERAARMWRAAASDGGGDFETASLVVTEGDRLLARGEERLSRYSSEQPPVSGQQAIRVQQWASEMELYGENGTLKSYTFGGAHAVLAALKMAGPNPPSNYQDIGGEGWIDTLKGCADTIGVGTITPPSEATARRIFDELRAGCQRLRKAIRDDPAGTNMYGSAYLIDPDGYGSSRRTLIHAIAELDQLAP
jgi:hypothetical protein